MGHTNAMIDPDGDLSELADEMVDAFMAAAKEEADTVAANEGADGAVFLNFLDRFENNVRSLV